MWIWEQEDWPNFSFNETKLKPLLDKAHSVHQMFIKQVSWLSVDFAKEAESEVLIEEAMQTSAIEGEILHKISVRSSVARHLGLPSESSKEDAQVEGLVDLLINASSFQQQLSKERLCTWHEQLFPNNLASIFEINSGHYRREEMYVMSGRHGHEIIHFKAPPSEQLEPLMEQFINWFNQSKLDGVLRAGITHFYFVTLHPFEDGNGRIARALIDLALSQFEQSDKRYYRLSSEIERQRKGYYMILESSQKGTLDITEYLDWFLATFIAAIERAEYVLAKILNKAKFWQQHYLDILNLRQKKVLNLLLDSGNEFAGNMNTRKYVSLNKVSRATAYRELSDLVEKGCLEVLAQGRSTSYKLSN